MSAFNLGRMSQVALKAKRQPITGIGDQLVGIITKDRCVQVFSRINVNCEVYVAGPPSHYQDCCVITWEFLYSEQLNIYFTKANTTVDLNRKGTGNEMNGNMNHVYSDRNTHHLYYALFRDGQLLRSIYICCDLIIAYQEHRPTMVH